jgi:hypothetical protein
MMQFPQSVSHQSQPVTKIMQSPQAPPEQPQSSAYAVPTDTAIAEAAISPMNTARSELKPAFNASIVLLLSLAPSISLLSFHASYESARRNPAENLRAPANDVHTAKG